MGCNPPYMVKKFLQYPAASVVPRNHCRNFESRLHSSTISAGMPNSSQHAFRYSVCLSIVNDVDVSVNVLCESFLNSFRSTS